MQYTHCIRSLSFSRLAMTPFALKYAFHPSRLRKSTKHKLYKTVIFSLPLEDLVIRLGIRRGAVWGLTGDPRRLWWRKDLTDYWTAQKKKKWAVLSSSFGSFAAITYHFLYKVLSRHTLRKLYKQETHKLYT